MACIFWPTGGNWWEGVFPPVPTAHFGVLMQQLNISFEPGLAERYESARECLLTNVYQSGHTRVAGMLDMAPSKLTEKLAGLRSDGKASGITLDELERYIAKTGDLQVIHYLAAKYCRDPNVVKNEALSRVAELMERLPGLLAAAGLDASSKPNRRGGRA